MTAKEERFAYRGPIWMMPVGLLLALLMWAIGAPSSGVLLVLHWSVIVVAAFGALATAVSRLKPAVVVLTEHNLAGPGRRSRMPPIDFASVESLVLREEGSALWSNGAWLEIRAPGRAAALWSNAFADRATFDSVVATVAERVAAHGGPALTRKPPSRAAGSFMA